MKRRKASLSPTLATGISILQFALDHGIKEYAHAVDEAKGRACAAAGGVSGTGRGLHAPALATAAALESVQGSYVVAQRSNAERTAAAEVFQAQLSPRLPYCKEPAGRHQSDTMLAEHCSDALNMETDSRTADEGPFVMDNAESAAAADKDMPVHRQATSERTNGVLLQAAGHVSEPPALQQPTARVQPARLAPASLPAPSSRRDSRMRDTGPEAKGSDAARTGSSRASAATKPARSIPVRSSQHSGPRVRIALLERKGRIGGARAAEGITGGPAPGSHLSTKEAHGGHSEKQPQRAARQAHGSQGGGSRTCGGLPVKDDELSSEPVPQGSKVDHECLPSDHVPP